MESYKLKSVNTKNILGVRVRDVTSGAYLWEHQHSDGTNFVIAENGHEYEVEISFTTKVGECFISDITVDGESMGSKSYKAAKKNGVHSKSVFKGWIDTTAKTNTRPRFALTVNPETTTFQPCFITITTIPTILTIQTTGICRAS
jgi:hypothetical protein